METMKKDWFQEFCESDLSNRTKKYYLNEGVCIEFTELLQAAGFNHPVIFSKTVWNEHIVWSDNDCLKQKVYDHIDTRMMDILDAYRQAIKNINLFSKKFTGICFKTLLIPRDGLSRNRQLTEFKLSVSRIEQSQKPIIFISLPNETLYISKRKP